MRPLRFVAVLSVAACGDAGADREERVSLASLPCASLDGTSGVWESAPFPVSASCGDVDAGPSACCPWILYRGSTVLTVEHGLGRMPRRVEGWVSFDTFGVGGTPASGDAFRVLSVGATEVVVENRTDQAFHLRLAIE